MEKLERTKKIIDETLREEARISCVFFSGGVDSLLVLYLLKDRNLPVVTFASDWTREQEKKLASIAALRDLTLYTYPPRARYVVPAGNGLTLVDEYGFGGLPLPVLRDIEPGETCLADLSADRFENFDFGFNTVFTGALREDLHEAIGRNWFEEKKASGPIEFVAPLFDWTKTEVLAAAEKFKLLDSVIEGTGEIKVCTRCLEADTFCPAAQKNIPKVDWNKEEAKSRFKERFGF